MNILRLSRGRFVALLLVAALVMTLIPAFSWNGQTRADDTQRIEMSIETQDSLQGKPKVLEYWSGELINPVASFNASGTGVNIPNATLTIRFPKSPFVHKPTFIDSALAQSSTAREDDDAWYMDYFFPIIRGGTVTDLSFPFKFKNLVTPNGVTVTPTWTLFDENGVQLRQESITFTAKSGSDYTPGKWYLGQARHMKRDGRNVGIYQFQVDDLATTTTTPAQGITVQYAVLANYSKPTDAPDGTGEFRPTKIRYVDHLPEGAELHPNSLKGGWVYDAATHTAVFEGTPRTPGGHCGYRICEFISLVYKNVPINEGGVAGTDDALKKIYTNTVDITMDPGMASEFPVGTADSLVAFHPVDKPRFSGSTHRAFMDKYYAAPHTWGEFNRNLQYRYSPVDNSLYYGQVKIDPADDNALGINWRLVSTQTNNGSSLDPIATGGIHDYLTEVKDIDLDPRLFYQSFEIPSNFDHFIGRTTNASLTPQQILDRFNTTPNILYGVKDDGTQVELGRNLSAGSTVNINDRARQYSGLKLVFSTPLEMDNYWVRFVVRALPTASEMAKWQSGEYTEAQTYSNKMATSWKYENDTAETQEYTREENQSNNAVQIAPINPSFGGWAEHSQTVAYENCEAKGISGSDLTVTNCSRLKKFRSYSRPAGNWATLNEPIKNLRHVVVLPSGVNYVRTDYMVKSGQKVSATEPRIVPNFRNTGKTALIWEFGDVDGQFGADWRAQNIVDFTLDTTIYAQPGRNVVETYYLWDNNDLIKPRTDNGYRSVTDTLDLDGDGKTDELFARADFTITFIPPQELITKKMVSIDGQGWSFQAPAGDLGGDLHYRMSIMNSALRPITGALTLIDVLPDTADHKIAPNQAGDYPDRIWSKIQEDGSLREIHHSAFITPLTGPAYTVEAIDNSGQTTDASHRFDTYYSLTPQGSDLASVRDAAWYTAEQITNWADVKAVKFVLRPGEKVESKEEIRFYTKHTIPWNEHTRSLDVGDKAVNSVAVSRDGVNFLEANEVTSEFTRYTVEGIAFKDLDKNGVAHSAEDRLAGVTATLVHATTGDVATLPDGTPITAQTDDNGHYFFDVFTRGDYRVRFTKDASQTFTKVEATADKKVANHAEVCAATAEDLPNATAGACSDTANNYGWSSPFSLHPLNRHEIRNVGFIVGTRDVKIEKIDQDGAPLSGITFTLTWNRPLDGEQAPAQTPAARTGQTDAQGRLTFEDIAFGQYTLTESNIPTGVQGISPMTLTVDGTMPAEPGEGEEPLPWGMQVTNTVIKGTVTVTKTDADSGAPLAGAVFVLKDASGDIKYTSEATGADGVATFANVIYGDYTLAELTAPANYLLNSTTEQVQVREHGQTVAVTRPFPNTPFKGTVTAKKVDTDTNTAIAGASFGLFPIVDGNTSQTAAYTATSGADGTIVFTDVRFGPYKLREITPATGYVANADERDVTITSDGQQVNLTAQPFTNTISKGTVTVKKVDFDDQTIPLAGVTFGLFAKNGDAVSPTPTQTQVTAANGIATFTNVRYGTYELRETATINGYELATTSQDVTVNTDGQTVEATQVTNRKILGTVKALKVETDQPSRALAGVGFGLFRVDGNGTTAAGAEFEATTDAQGVVTFENVTAGAYKLKETTPLASHIANTTDERDVVVTKRDQVIDLTGEPFKNPIKRADVVVKKVETGTTKAIAGTRFTLFARTVDASGAEHLSEYAQAVTNDSGIATFAQVPYGDYTVRETQAATGYNLSSETQGRAVQVRENNHTVSLVDQPFENTPITSTVTVRKVDEEDNTQVLQGVRFGLFPRTGEGTYAQGATYEATSDAQGIVTFTGVRFGEYQLREIETLANYNLSQETRVVNVTTNGETVELGDFNNAIIKGSVTFKKMDADDTSRAVPGAIFALSQNGEVKYQATADASGLVAFSGVIYGDYTLTEVSAPENYVLNANWSQAVTIRTQDQIVDLKTVTNTLKKATVTVIKRNADQRDDNGVGAPLAGARFALMQNGETKYTALSGADGVATFNDVIYGDYTLAEVEAPTGFVLNTSTQDIQIRENGAVIAANDIENKLIRGNIQVTKTSDKGHPLAGAVFELRDAAGHVLEEATSGADGIATFTAIPYDTYTVVEKTPPTGYLLNTQELTATIEHDGVTVKAGDIINERIIGHATVLKTDVNGVPLEGATFELRGQDGAVVATATSADNGIARFDNVEYGDYTIVETVAPTGYLVDSTAVTVHIREHGVTVDAGTFVNQRIVGRIALMKVNAQQEPLAGATFELRNSDGQLVREATTDDNGRLIFENVEYGDYKVVETVAPTGYVLDGHERAVQVREHGVTVEVEPIVNERIRADVVVHKTNESGRGLAGATFELRRADGTVAGHATSDIFGKAVFDDVEYGNYTVSETHAPSGYIRSDKVLALSVMEHHVTVEAGSIVNKAQAGKSLAFTGPIDAGVLAGTVLMLTCGGLGLRRKFRTHM